MMIKLLKAVMGARVVRPLWWWVLAVIAYVVVPVPPWWALLPIVGLGVALTATMTRLREATGLGRQRAPRVWKVAGRAGPAYDPGALLACDHVLPELITTGAVEGVRTGAALILPTLGIQPDDQTGTFQRWPVMARIIDAAAHKPPCQPPHRHRQWGRS